MPDPFAPYQKPSKKRFLPHITAGLLAATMSLTAPREGEVLQSYWDSIGGVWTACDGHTKGVVPGKKYTHEECQVLLALDDTEALTTVLQALRVPEDDSTVAAMGDFTLNVGAGAFLNSSMLRDLNAGAHDQACRDLFKYVCAGRTPGGVDHGPPCHKKNYVKGLANGRTQEYAVCMKETK